MGGLDIEQCFRASIFLHTSSAIGVRRFFLLLVFHTQYVIAERWLKLYILKWLERAGDGFTALGPCR